MTFIPVSVPVLLLEIFLTISLAHRYGTSSIYYQCGTGAAPRENYNIYRAPVLTSTFNISAVPVP